MAARFLPAIPGARKHDDGAVPQRNTLGEESAEDARQDDGTLKTSDGLRSKAALPPIQKPSQSTRVKSKAKVGPQDHPSTQVVFTSRTFDRSPSPHNHVYVVNQTVRKSIFKTATQERADHRFTWPTNFDFWLVSIAYVVGFTNFLGFPQMCQKYGGMAFCIPYFTVVVFMGLPLYFLETILGQYSGHGSIAVMNELVPAFVGIAYALVINNFVSFMRSEVAIAKVTYLLSVTLKAIIPWAICKEDNDISCYTVADDLYCRDVVGNDSVFFNLTCTSVQLICKYANTTLSPKGNNTCLLQNGESRHFTTLINRTIPEEEFYYKNIQNMEGASLAHLGPIHWPMFFSLAACWVMTYIMGRNGFITTIKSAYFTFFGPFAGCIIVAIKVFSLSGAWTGMKVYLKFEPSSLMQPEIWVDAISTCNHSLGLGLGILTALASANKPYKNCLKTSIAVICADTLASLACGLLLFSLLGHMAESYGTTVEALLAQNRDVIFTTIPEALAMLEYPRIYIVICYGSMALMSFGYLAAVIALTTYDGKDIFNSIFNRSGVDDEKKASHVSIYQYNAITCCLGFAASILYIVKGGTLVLRITDPSIHFNMAYLIAATLPIVICLFYGSGRVMDLIEHELNISLWISRPYWAVTWNVTAPCLLLWAAFKGNKAIDYDGMHKWQVASIMFTYYPFLIIVCFFLVQIYLNRHEGFTHAFQPSRKWCMGLDITLLFPVTEHEPELMQKHLERAQSRYASSTDFKTERDKSRDESLPLIDQIIVTEPSDTEPDTIEPRAKKSRPMSQLFSQKFLDHTLRDTAYVPFGKQLLEGQKVRLSIALEGGRAHSLDSKPYFKDSTEFHGRSQPDGTMPPAGSATNAPPGLAENGDTEADKDETSNKNSGLLPPLQ